eukprot:18088-Heterococcus_DN1.PRE.1
MKLAGVTMVSRTMLRIASLLRLRRGRARCGTHTLPWLLTFSGALEPPTGSNGAVLCTTTLSGVATMEGTVRECAAADAVDCSNAAGCTKAFAPACNNKGAQSVSCRA